MSWLRATSSDYAPLPTSTTPSSPSIVTGSSTSSARPSSYTPPSRQRYRKLYYLLAGATILILLSSLWIVPEENLPERVGNVVGNAKSIYGDATTKYLGWKSQSLLDEEEEESEGQAGVVKGEEGGQIGEEEWKGPVETVEVGKGLDPDVLIPLTGRPGEGEDGEILTVEEEIVCSDEVRTMLGEPSFWIVKATSPLHYTISARNPLPSNVAPACLSQAVFSAHLVQDSSSISPSPATQTLIALPRPGLSDELSSFEIDLSSSKLDVPKTTYELKVILEFGFYPGVIEGTCGEDVKVCDEISISREHGDQLKYLGERVEVREEDKFVELGREQVNEDELPICRDLSSLEGYWSSLTFHPTSPAPCKLFTPTFPLPFVPPIDSTATNTTEKVPFWIHFVGDSNTRNMHSHLLNSLGNGHKTSAPKVIDSKTHNGTHASFATRWKGGEIPKGGGEEEEEVPDLILTWSWWYQSTPLPLKSDVEGYETIVRTSEEEEEEAWQSNVDSNREDLINLVNSTLSEYLVYSNLERSLRQHPGSYSPRLRKLATTLRPHRTYLSLGSHSEGLSLPGTIDSLSQFFSPTNGLGHPSIASSTVGESMRWFTTTLVNPNYIPLDRFPHQDLIRNNAFIESKNQYLQSHLSSSSSSIINVESITKGIVEEEGGIWMKPPKQKGRSPDAVHFRDEVYEEWVRIVWTDLMRDVRMEGGVVEEEEKEKVEELGEVRKRWKRRIEEWREDEEEDDDDE